MAQTGDKDTSVILAELQQKGEEFAKKIVVEKKRLKDLNDAIQHITNESEKFRANAKKWAIKCLNKNILTPNPAFQRADGVNVGREAELQTKKSIVQCESNLNRLLQRRSEVDIQNEAIKHDIDHMRKVRMRTDESQNRFEVVLGTTKEKIEKLMNEASGVIEERDRLVEMKESLELQNTEEQKIFEEEFEELGKYIKEQNTALEEALLHDRKDDSDKALGDSLPPTDFDDENKMASKVGKLSHFVKNEQSSHESIHKKIKQYEEMFKELQEMTNTTSLNEIISSYSSHEEEMFSLFSYIQSMNTDTETITESTQALEVEINRYKQEQAKALEAEDKVRSELEKRLAEKEEQLAYATEQNKQYTEGVDQIIKKIQSMFYKLQCDQIDNGKNNTQQQKSKGVTVSKPDNKIALLMGQKGPTEANVLDYMGVIEQRAIDIITMYIRDHRQIDSPHSPTPGPVTPMHNVLQSMPLFDVTNFNEDDWADDDLGDGKPVDTRSFKKSIAIDSRAKVSKTLGNTNPNKGNNNMTSPTGGMSPTSMF